MMTDTTTTVTLKFYNAQNGFGFFKRNKGKDLFIHVSTIYSSGFTPEHVKAGTLFEVEWKMGKKGPEVSKIVTIDNLTAANMKQVEELAAEKAAGG